MSKKKVFFNFDKDTGIATTTINTELGKFTGRAMYAKDKEEFPPVFYMGENLSASRAYIAYYNAKIRQKKAELKGIYRLKHSCNYDLIVWRYASQMEKAINQEIAELIDKKDEERRSINEIIESRKVYIHARKRNANADEIKEYQERIRLGLKMLGQKKANEKS